MKYICFSLLLSVASLPLFSQNTSSLLTITNAKNIATNLTANDISAMPHTTLRVTAHDGKTHSYDGVFLYTLLQKAGVSLGDSAKKKTAGSYVVITASDNYKTVYAMGEIDTLQSYKKILLADKIDGQALPQNALTYQIIATEEKIHARMIRQVVSIAVREAE